MKQSVINLILKFVQPAEQWKISLLQVWPDIVKELDWAVQLLSVRNQVLYVGVQNASLAQELRFNAMQIVQKINARIFPHQIVQLKILLTSQHQPLLRTKKLIAKPKIRKPKQVPTQDAMLNVAEGVALNKIKDQDLRTSLCNFLMRTRLVREPDVVQAEQARERICLPKFQKELFIFLFMFGYSLYVG